MRGNLTQFNKKMNENPQKIANFGENYLTLKKF